MEKVYKVSRTERDTIKIHFDYEVKAEQAYIIHKLHRLLEDVMDEVEIESQRYDQEDRALPDTEDVPMVSDEIPVTLRSEGVAKVCKDTLESMNIDN